MALESLHNIPGGFASADIVDKLIKDLFDFADTEEYNTRTQLIINTLAQYDIIKYIDDTSIPCNNSTELFDEDIRQLERLDPVPQEQPDECDDIDGIFCEEEDYYEEEAAYEEYAEDCENEDTEEYEVTNNNDNIDDLFDELMNGDDRGIIERDEIPF